MYRFIYKDLYVTVEKITRNNIGEGGEKCRRGKGILLRNTIKRKG